MHATTSKAPDATLVDIRDEEDHKTVLPQPVFPFLKLPRELRDQIYDHVFRLQDHRSERALRIERRNLKQFKPSPAALLLVLHHEYFLLNQQVAREALQVLLKSHTVFLSCGPFVLKSLLEKVEQQNGLGRQWLNRMKKIELDWVTFPNLKLYPPDREDGRDTWYWEQDESDVQVDYVRGAQHHGHYDEYDHEGGHYEDNFYEASNTSLYPSFHQPSISHATSTDDPFGFASHYPFADPSQDATQDVSAEDVTTKLDLLVSMEVLPLFTYLASQTFNLTSITVPLYFISKHAHHHRSITRPGYALPLKIRYWVQVCIQALLMLTTSNRPLTQPPLQQVRVKYLPWDIWASMDPADDLHRMVEKGLWFDDPDAAEGGGRESEGEAFRAVWADMRAQVSHEGRGTRRFGLSADVKFVPWDGNVDSCRVGDELEVVFTKNSCDSMEMESKTT
ncbi:hypothetical protein BKA66DRAFT_508199 [Pyrenochaeta sp. MPI-SDFR-AT-0127]|nr:hypothetical protein BKA66DRAFT_508199 [Pyrenochaeta sp. MPI-SDFR-AT-0127]